MEGEVGPRGISERPLNKNTEISSAGAFPKPSVVIRSSLDAPWTLINSCWSAGYHWDKSGHRPPLTGMSGLPNSVGDTILLQTGDESEMSCQRHS